MKLNKSYFFIFVLMLSTLSGCMDTSAQRYPINQIPDNYSLEDAEREICLIIEDYDVIYGDVLWNDFLKGVENKNTSSIRIVIHNTDQENIYVQDLTYDNGVYTYAISEDHDSYPKEYEYLVRLEADHFIADTVYVLTHDNSITMKDILNSILSSDSNNWIEYDIVYYDKTATES